MCRSAQFVILQEQGYTRVLGMHSNCTILQVSSRLREMRVEDLHQKHTSQVHKNALDNSVWSKLNQARTGIN